MLKTVDAIVDALGGTSEVAVLTGVSLPAVSNWKTRRRIPSEKFMIVADALEQRGVKADPDLFGFDTSEARP